MMWLPGTGGGDGGSGEAHSWLDHKPGPHLAQEDAITCSEMYGPVFPEEQASPSLSRIVLPTEVGAGA